MIIDELTRTIGIDALVVMSVGNKAAVPLKSASGTLTLEARERNGGIITGFKLDMFNDWNDQIPKTNYELRVKIPELPKRKWWQKPHEPRYVSGEVRTEKGFLLLSTSRQVYTEAGGEFTYVLRPS